MIEKYQRARVFGSLSCNMLSCIIWENENAWMTKQILFDSQRRPDSFNSSTTVRELLEYMDSCSAHGGMGSLPEVQPDKVHSTHKFQLNQ